MLVDPERFLALLGGSLVAPAERPRPLVQRDHRAAALCDPRHLGDHLGQVERVMERGHAEGQVEGARGEGKMLAVGLDALVVADALGEEGAASDPDLVVVEDVGGDVFGASAGAGAGMPMSSPRRPRGF